MSIRSVAYNTGPRLSRLITSTTSRMSRDSTTGAPYAAATQKPRVAHCQQVGAHHPKSFDHRVVIADHSHHMATDGEQVVLHPPGVARPGDPVAGREIRLEGRSY